jgi:3-vinyl bacteriochlorophyllide hydratase
VESFEVITQRRQASAWTKIHPLFALAQLLVFFVSLVLLVLYAFGRVSFSTVHVSVLIKVGFMLGAVITGSLWEHDVFGRWWFANDFFVEDVMTANVFLLHVLYLGAFYAWPANHRAIVALLVVAYGVYGLNVGQYIWRHHLMKRHAQRYAPITEIAA